MESFGCFEDGRTEVWTQVKEKLFSVSLWQRLSDCKLVLPQFEPHVCLLNGMGVSHPAFPYSSSPAGNSIRGGLCLLPQEQHIYWSLYWMKKNNSWLFCCLYPASIPFLLLLNPLTLAKGAQQPAPSSMELNCKSGDAAVGASHPFQFCVTAVPPMRPGQILRKCSQHLLIEPSDEVNFWFSKKPVIWSQPCLGQPRLSHKTEENFCSSAYNSWTVTHPSGSTGEANLQSWVAQ